MKVNSSEEPHHAPCSPAVAFINRKLSQYPSEMRILKEKIAPIFVISGRHPNLNETAEGPEIKNSQPKCAYEMCKHSPGDKPRGLVPWRRKTSQDRF